MALNMTKCCMQQDVKSNEDEPSLTSEIMTVRLALRREEKSQVKAQLISLFNGPNVTIELDKIEVDPSCEDKMITDAMLRFVTLLPNDIVRVAFYRAVLAT